MPAATPVTVPDVASTVAVVVGEIVQVPPMAPLLKFVVAPVQTCSMPPIGVGPVFTFTVVVMVQPVVAV